MAQLLGNLRLRGVAANLVRRIGLIACLVAGCLGLVALGPGSAAAGPPQAAADFAQLVSRLAVEAGGDSPNLRTTEEQALAVLDRTALAALNMPAPDLDALNSRLAQMVTRQPPLGESYRVLRLSGSPAAYLLVANFGVAGPSAIRVYAGAAGKLALAGRVDRFAQPIYADEFVEVIPWNSAEPPGLFLTISGRTDEEQTGVFGAWRFNGRDVNYVWVSDILEQSSYDLGPDGFRVTYCGEPDVNDPAKCLHRMLDRYGWHLDGWRLLESTELPDGGKAGGAGAPSK